MKHYTFPLLLSAALLLVVLLIYSGNSEKTPNARSVTMKVYSVTTTVTHYQGIHNTSAASKDPFETLDNTMQFYHEIKANLWSGTNKNGAVLSSQSTGTFGSQNKLEQGSFTQTIKSDELVNLNYDQEFNDKSELQQDKVVGGEASSSGIADKYSFE